MSLVNYKTNVNGSEVTLNDIFSSESDNDNSSVSDQFKVGGSSVLKGNSFSNAANSILANLGTNTDFTVAGYDHNDRPDPSTPTSKAWGYNSAIQIGTMGFDDKQSNVGYKKNGSDIGPVCCAKYIDYTGATGNIYIPTWVDYFNVIAVGEGGNKGSGRTGSIDAHAQGGTGTSGGFIAWKSKTNLGNVRKQYSNTYYKIDLYNGTILFNVYENGTLTNWCQANKGLTGAQATGNDDDDTHADSIKAEGYYTSQNSLTSFSGGSAYVQRFVTGNPCTAPYSTPNYASNMIGDIVYGWDNYGKGQDWKNNNTTTSDRGAASIRVYYIGYDVS